MFRFFALLLAIISLSACENIDDISGKPAPIGEFALGHNIVVAPALVMGPASREASGFSRYDGDQLYHFGISLEGYVLAQPGIPFVLSPKSALIIKLTVWDDAEGKKLNEEPEQITILESVDGESIVGSGLTKTAEEQMAALSLNAAKMIQRYITRQHRQQRWFKRKAGAPAKVESAPEEATEETLEATPTDVPAEAAAVAETAENVQAAGDAVEQTAEASVAAN